jgi:hypothetical protein
MATTLTEINERKAELQAKLEARKAQKKGTKELREAIAALEAEAEKITEKAARKTRTKRVGRPRKYVPEFYRARERFARAGRGRPSRAQVEADLTELGVKFDKDADFRTLEVTLKDAKTRMLENLKKIKP